MEENKEVVTEEQKVETPAEQPAAEEKKAEAKVEKKAKKAEKASLAQRAKSAVKRNKKVIVGTAAGFVSGVASAIGGAMYLGHKHRKAEELAMREAPVIPDYNEPSPLDPNVE